METNYLTNVGWSKVHKELQSFNNKREQTAQFENQKRISADISEEEIGGAAIVEY